MRHKFFFFLLIVALVAPTHGIAGSSVNVPLDSWVYPVLDRLSGLGLFSSYLKGTKPVTRLEVARLLVEASYRGVQVSEKAKPLIEYLLERLREEFSVELASLGVGGEKAPKNFVRVIDELKARYVYVDGEPRTFSNFPLSPNKMIKATEGTPLVPNNEGVVYGEHHNFSLQFSSTVNLFDTFSGYVEPILLVRQNLGSLGTVDNTAEVDLLKGYGKLSKWNVEIEAGRDSLWWGQGYRGTLLMTNNAAPLNMIKLSNPSPIQLPWVLEYLGPFKYTFILSELEADRDWPYTKLGGMRLDFKPHPLFEMAWNRTFLFGGSGTSTDSFSYYFKVLTLQVHGGGNTDRIDELDSFDFRLRLPWLRNAEVYFEWGAEDSGGYKPDIRAFVFQNLAFLVGAYFPDVTGDGRTDLRIEYADNTSEWNNYLWYSHGFYRSGYTYKEFILGHSMGTDARDYFLRGTHYLRNDLLIGMDLDYMENGRFLGPVIEKNYQLGIDTTYDISRYLTIVGRYAFGRVLNYNAVDGDDRYNNVFIAELKYRF